MHKKRILKICKWFFGTILSLFLLISLLLWVFKDDICQLAIDQVNKHLNTKVTVSEVDLTFWSTFPNLSVDFNHVFIQDASPGSTNRDTLLFTEKIRCKVNPFDVWREEYKVKSLEIFPGVMNLRVNEKGENNYGILKESEESGDEPVELALQEVNFKNFRFNYINDATSQKYETYIRNLKLDGELSKDVFTTAAISDLQIVSAQSGNITLVSNKPAKLAVNVKVDTKAGKVEIPNSTIHVANLPFNFNGVVDTTGFNFKLSGKNIGIEDAANNLAMKETENIKDFSGTGTLLFDLNINGRAEATAPVEVTCDFGVEKGTLRDPNSRISMRDLQIEGAYSNVGGPEKEFVQLKNISFQTEGGPFRANLKITEFEKPLFQGDAVGLLNLAVVRSLFKLTDFKQLNGTVDVSSQFAVQTVVNKDETTSYNIKKCEGEVIFNKIRAQLEDDKRVYRDIEGRMYLRNDRVGMEKISLKIGSSDFAIDGIFKDVVEYFSDRGNLVADVDIRSSRIDLSDLGSDSKEDIMHQERAFILPANIEGEVYLDVEKLKYEKHYFNKLKGNMNMFNRKIHFPKLSVNNGGADATGSVTISEDRPEIFNISSHIVSNNIQFDKLFKEWDNFDQEVIKSHNISGQAKANIRFEAPFDLRSGIISKAIEANIGIQIDNGRLRNVEAFREITQSLNEMSSARLAIGKENIKSFEKKLLDLRFDKLENTLIIRDGVIVIPSMSVNSSALDIEISGKHTFDNQIDYRFGFRFQDLKEQKQSEFGDIVDDGTGKHVFMRMYGSLYDPNFEWDAAANKEHKQQQREQEKQDVKSIFKTEFGMFKNDTTVQEYVKERRPHEIIEVLTNPTEENDEIIERTTPKRDSKALKWLKAQQKEMKEERGGGEKIEWELN